MKQRCFFVQLFCLVCWKLCIDEIREWQGRRSEKLRWRRWNIKEKYLRLSHALNCIINYAINKWKHQVNKAVNSTHTLTHTPHTHIHTYTEKLKTKKTNTKEKTNKKLKKKTNKREYYSNKKCNAKFLFTKMSFYYRLISVNGPSLWPPRRGRLPQFMSRCFWQFYSHLGWRLLSPFRFRLQFRFAIHNRTRFPWR